MDDKMSGKEFFGRLCVGFTLSVLVLAVVKWLDDGLGDAAGFLVTALLTWAAMTTARGPA